MNEQQPKFDFYERVRIVAPQKGAEHLRDSTGAVLGRAMNESGGWSYAVHVYEQPDGWSFPESALQTMGEFAKREDFYTGESIRVSPDGEPL